jgi:general secretion pathway protein G
MLRGRNCLISVDPKHARRLSRVLARGPVSRKRQPRSRGFTLLELMIVISIVMILMAVAVPMYNQAIVQARESVLRSNLSVLRDQIQHYTLDKQKAPQSLDDIVTAGYLRQIPVDPMTRLPNWEVVQEDYSWQLINKSPVSRTSIPPRTVRPATAPPTAVGRFSWCHSKPRSVINPLALS